MAFSLDPKNQRRKHKEAVQRICVERALLKLVFGKYLRPKEFSMDD
jgi:hypothetical protein